MFPALPADRGRQLPPRCLGSSRAAGTAWALRFEMGRWLDDEEEERLRVAG